MSAPVNSLITRFHTRFYGAKEVDPIAAVLYALPTDPQERQLLLDEFDQHPDERFAVEVLGALAQFKHQPEKVREVRSRLGLDWRSLVDHPDLFSRKDQDVLDELQDVLPVGRDTFDQWITRALQQELLYEHQISFKGD